MSPTRSNGPGAANDRPVMIKQKAAIYFIAKPKRSRATLVEVVDALSQPERTGAVVFQSTLDYLGTRVFVVFREDVCKAYPLAYCEPGSARLRLAIETAGFGTVSAAMLRDALNASKFPSISWVEFEQSKCWEPQKLPMRVIEPVVQLLGVQP
jgi:hypothetical protein